MRIDKLGSRFLRVITPDGETRYFSRGHGFASLRLFWIFRNFATLNDRLLTVQQRELIRQIYRTGEVRKQWIDPTNILGTLEVSNLASTDDWTMPGRRVIQLAIVPPPIMKAKPTRSLRSLVLSANGLAAVSLLALIVVASRNARLQSEGFASNTGNISESLPAQLPKQTNETPRATPVKAAIEQGPAQPAVLKPTLTVGDGVSPPNDPSNSLAEVVATGAGSDADVVNIRPVAVLQRADEQPISSEAPPSIPNPDRHSVSSTSFLWASSTDDLPPSGPPQTHPVLGEFSSVEQDTEVILRAIVSADGSVTKVKVLEGDSKLAREAAHAVTSWRYSPRASTGYAESRIAFHFAPDTVSVSFLDAATPNTRR